MLLLLLVPLTVAGSVARDKPPQPLHAGVTAKAVPAELDQAYHSWTPGAHCNIWELSGLFEGDIMVEGDPVTEARNAVSDPGRLWPGAVVSYYIDTDDFDKDERKLIRSAIKNIEEETCIQFRPYKSGDPAYVLVQGSRSGCWSYVGRKAGGQILNLGSKCVRYGVVLHELLHALGLHHQQSAFDRDNYVIVHWENIEEDHKHNFNKYNSSSVTDYGVGYDYKSIMHYSAYAFSKNEEITIAAKDKKAKIGQRKALSKKDILKVNTMYKCLKTNADEDDTYMSDIVNIMS